jgi:THO complex subunit 4
MMTRKLTSDTQIEIVVSAAKAAEIVPTPKTLTERITQPKAQPKSAANDKKKGAAKAVGTGARGRKPRPTRNSRPAKKTAEELDSEMADYFESGNQNENTNGVATNTNGDAAMDDEISVSSPAPIAVLSN